MNRSKVPDKKLTEQMRAYALKNALAYKGKTKEGAIISGLFHEGKTKEEINEYHSLMKEIIEKINSMSFKQQEKEFKKIKKFTDKRKEREGLPEIPDAQDGVIMRFSPSASGPMHIGHALIFCLNSLYVKKYGGTFYLRIEDTNPENIYAPAYKLLEEEGKWLSEGQSKIIIQSERMKIYYKYARELIENEFAYICTCEGETFREFAKKKANCPCRTLSKKEHILRWRKMLNKEGYQPGEAILRFKSDMKDKNPAKRDFPLARINLHKHPKVGNKYRVWPLMNLAVTIDDIELKISHIIRGKDHRDNAERQKLIYKSLNKKFPWTAFIGRVNFKGMKLSTTEFRKGIESGTYSGWDDPKLPTIISLKKKGYSPEDFYKLAELIGLSEVDKVIDQETYLKILGKK